MKLKPSTFSDNFWRVPFIASVSDSGWGVFPCQTAGGTAGAQRVVVASLGRCWVHAQQERHP